MFDFRFKQFIQLKETRKRPGSKTNTLQQLLQPMQPRQPKQQQQRPQRGNSQLTRRLQVLRCENVTPLLVLLSKI